MAVPAADRVSYTELLNRYSNIADKQIDQALHLVWLSEAYLLAGRWEEALPLA